MACVRVPVRRWVVIIPGLSPHHVARDVTCLLSSNVGLFHLHPRHKIRGSTRDMIAVALGVVVSASSPKMYFD